MPPPPELTSITDTAARDLAREILARPEYAQYREQTNEWIRKLVAWFIQLLELIPTLYYTAPVLYFALLISLALLATLLLVHMVKSLRQALRAPEPPPSAARQLDRDFSAEAHALAAQGEYLEASHRLLLGCLAQAARAGVIELKPDDGNSAVCDKLRRSPLPRELSARLITLILETDAVWFGGRVLRSELYADWSATYAQLRAAA